MLSCGGARLIPKPTFIHTERKNELGTTHFTVTLPSRACATTFFVVAKASNYPTALLGGIELQNKRFV